MAPTTSRITSAVTRRAKSRIGKRFGRFAIAAAVALAANEITVAGCVVAQVNAGTAGGLGWLAGSVVSYILSRWAFGRRSRPSFLKETLPFWVVSAMVFVILYLATKLGSHVADWLHLPKHSLERVGFVVGVNFLANCFTFVARFVFFHYVLFADRGSAVAALPDAAGTPEEPFVRAEASSELAAELPEDEDDDRGDDGTRWRSRHQVP
jgi:hypothetical protein